MKKKIIQGGIIQPPKAVSAMLDAFVSTFSPALKEEEADDFFTVAKLRQYFNAWPIPKMPDPLPPYIKELGENGYVMLTGYDGRATIFVKKRISLAGLPIIRHEKLDFGDEDEYIEEEE